MKIKPVLKFLVITATIVFLSAFLAPLLFRILPYKFERIFNRLIMIFSLISVFVFVRFRKELIGTWGLTPDKSSLRFLGAGFLSGLGVLGGLLAVKVFGGVAFFKPLEIGVGGLCLQMAGALGAAALIGLLEEFFFRGVIYTALEKRLKWGAWSAVFVTSLFYALVHFVSEKKIFVGPEPVFWDGLRLAMAPFRSLVHWPEFWREAVGLFLFGVVLNDMFIRTRALYAGIGLHAGCVFFVKMDGFFINYTNDRPFLLGSAEMVDSLAAWILIAALGLGWHQWVRTSYLKEERR